MTGPIKALVELIQKVSTHVPLDLVGIFMIVGGLLFGNRAAEKRQ